MIPILYLRKLMNMRLQILKVCIVLYYSLKNENCWWFQFKISREGLRRYIGP